MEIQQKITQKEWKQYVENQMYHYNFTQIERDQVRAAFAGDLGDTENGEAAGLFGQIRPGITEGELTSTMAMLRDPHSSFSKSMRIHLSEEKINKLEEILHAALIENKEGFF